MRYYYRRKKKKFTPKKELIDQNKIIKLGQLEKLDNHELLEQESFYQKDIEKVHKRLDINNHEKEIKNLKKTLIEIKEKKLELKKEFHKVFSEENHKREVTYWIKRKSSFWGANKNEGFKNTRLYMVNEVKGEKLLERLKEFLEIKNKISNLGEIFKYEVLYLNQIFIENGISNKKIFSTWDHENTELVMGFDSIYDEKGKKLESYLSKYIHQPQPSLFPWEYVQCSKLIYYSEIPKEKGRFGERIWNESKFSEKIDSMHSAGHSFTFWKPLDTKVIEEKKKIIIEFYQRALRKIELIRRSRLKREQKDENLGWVYAMSNKDLPPNTYKIGSTYGNTEERAEELTGTGHLNPFKVVCKIKIQSAERYEKIVHKIFKKYRIRKDREFFTIEIGKIKDCFKQIMVLSEEGKKKIEVKTLIDKIKI